MSDPAQDPSEELIELDLDSESEIGANALLTDEQREHCLQFARQKNRQMMEDRQARRAYSQKLKEQWARDWAKLQEELRKPLPPPPPTTGLSLWKELELKDLRNRIQYNKTKG